ncbi:MAG TPA: hypothetical protein VEI58_04240 [Chthoniobacterales bacterium]|nr:hypothetical protein [Chthoniobacterales bacterium]
MKPTPQVTHNQSQHRGFPLTDYNFQATADPESSCAAVRPERKSFWKLSTEFFGAETHFAAVAELLFFTVIAAISAWPIVFTLHAITRMVRNY